MKTPLTVKDQYERLAKYVYSACRYGLDVADVHNWMADDLGVPRPHVDAELGPRELYAAFFAKHATEEEFQADYLRLIEAIKR